MANPQISVVTPVFGSAASLNELYDRLSTALSQISEEFEIIMVNDASPDGAWDIIQKLARKDDRVKGINLSRNFGQHYAITAGLDYAKGFWIVVMDSDLQDQPEEISRFYAKAREGFDVVVGRRAERHDSFFRRTLSRLFNLVFNYFTGLKIDHRLGSFGIYKRRVVKNIIRLREQNRSFGLFALWVGFDRVEIDIDHASRPYGSSAYTFSKMVNLAIDSVIAHSTRLLRVSIKIGFLLAFFSFAYSLWLIARYFVWSIPVEGWTSLMVSIYFSAGIILVSIGILGTYLGKIFDEVKQRPLYIVESTTFEALPNAE